MDKLKEIISLGLLAIGSSDGGVPLSIGLPPRQ